MLPAFCKSHVALHFSNMQVPPSLSLPRLLCGPVLHLICLQRGLTYIANVVVLVVLIGVIGALLDMVLSLALPHLIMQKLLGTYVARIGLCHV